jgi:hypothetical protein
MSCVLAFPRFIHCRFEQISHFLCSSVPKIKMFGPKFNFYNEQFSRLTTALNKFEPLSVVALDVIILRLPQHIKSRHGRFIYSFHIYLFVTRRANFISCYSDHQWIQNIFRDPRCFFVILPHWKSRTSGACVKQHHAQLEYIVFHAAGVLPRQPGLYDCCICGKYE